MKSRPIERTAGDDAAVAPRSSWTKKAVLGGLGTAGVSVALAAFAASAFANAANPLPDSQGTITPVGNGAVRVDVSGTWNWGQLSGSSPQSDCTGRSGVGWSVDWWGISNGAAQAIPGLTGSVVNPATSSSTPPTTTTGSLAPSGTWQIKSGGLFHTSHQYNGFTTDLCSHKDAQGFPEGPWSASATYPSAADVPAKLCVNFYDPHGQQGKYSTSANDNFADLDGDNSIKTNAFNPAANAGYCFTPTFSHPLAISVDKTNDANHDGTFTKTETANSAGQNVDFKVVVTNTSQSATEVIDSPITDAFSGQSNNVCASLVGQVLAPGASTTCTFTVNNYAPANGSLTDTVTVPVHEQGLPQNSTSGQSTSTVNAPVNATLASHILLCSDNSQVPGGTLHQTAGGTHIPDAAQIPAMTVVAGHYTIAATAPVGFHLVSCGPYLGQTSQSVDLNPGDHGLLDFFVAPNGAPNVTVAKSGPATGIAGGQGTYKVTLGNNGSATAPNPIHFIDVLPTGETFVSATGTDMTCSATGQTINCTYAHDLAVNGTASVSVVVSYAANTAGQTLTDCASLDANSPKDCVDTHINEPNLVIAKKGPATGTAGGQGTYTITVTNTGSGPAPSATFVDKLPAGETFVSATGATCAPSAGNAQNIDCTLPGTLAANGGSASVTVVVSFGANTGGQTLTDCAVLPNNQQDCVDTHIGQPNLVIQKTGPATGTAGGQGTYTIKVTNNGDAAATSVTFVDRLPAGETFVSATGATCTPAAGNAQNINCSVPGTLAANGGSASVTVVVSYGSNTAGQTLTDCAILPNNQQDCVDTHIGQPHLVIQKTGPATGVPGGRGTYSIKVTNTGDGPATNVSFVDALPAGETFVSATGGVCTAAGQTVTCSVPGTLAANGGSATVDVVVSYDQNTGGQTLTDCASVPGSQSCADTHILTPDLRILKTGPATGTAGGQGTYTITVSNVGQAPASNVTFVDALPVGETFVSATGNGVSCAVSAANAQLVNCSLASSLASGSSASVQVTISYGANTGGQTLTDCAKLDAFNQSCVDTKIPGHPTLVVVKTNDANADGVFHDTETANAPGDSVTFTAVVTNTSNVAVVIDSVTDAYGATTQNTCAQLVGTLLAPGQSMTCVFTVANYAPAAGSSLTDTVTFTGHENGNPGNTTTGADTSTVLTKTPPTPGAPDLAILKTASLPGVHPGDTLVYGLTVSNVGAGPTTGAITVTDSVPAGLSIDSVDGGSAWTCSVSGQDITCTYQNGALAPGATAAQITVTTTVNSNAAGTLINTGVVKTPGDVNPSNDTSTVKTPVTAVLPEVIKKPTTPTTPVTPTPTVLPFTGSNAGAMLPVGLLMLLGGMMFLVLGRRRRHSA